MRFFCLNIVKRDIFKTDHWKNVSYFFGSLISNFFTLNGEILTKTIIDFSIPEKFFFDIQDTRLKFFQSHPCLAHTQKDICSFGNPAIDKEHCLQIYHPSLTLTTCFLRLKTAVLAPSPILFYDLLSWIH